jgi:hypothetical protein
MATRRTVEQSDEPPRALDAASTGSEVQSGADAVLRLQQSAGNASVARYLASIQRQPFTFTQPSPPPSVIPPVGSGGAIAQGLDKRRAEIKALIVAFLDKEHAKPAGDRTVNLSLSLAEVVAAVRGNVKESLELAPDDVSEMVQSWGAPHGLIFPHRSPGDREGAEKELIATVANSLSAIPTELQLKRKGGFITISTGGVEVGYKSGEVEVKAETEWGDSIGVSAAVGKVHFGAKLEPAKGHEPVKWEATIAFPEAESMVPLMGSLSGLFSKANSSMAGLTRELKRGASPSDMLVKEKLEPVKKSMEAVSAISKASSPALGIKVEGEGPEVKVTATLTFSF